MRNVILGVKVVTLVVWTVICWGAYLVFKVAAAVLEAVLGSVPLVNWLVGVASGLGVGLIFIVWLVGAGVIVVVGLLARRVAG